MDNRLKTAVGPVLALLVIGVMEALAGMGVLVVSPGVVLLLPVMYTAATSSGRATILTSLIALAYQIRHFALDRNEYANSARGLSGDDVSRLAIFAVAVVGLVALARFRESQRQVEIALQNAYRSAMEANRAKSEFLAMVSHELRTPLTAIIQYGDLLAAGVAGDLNGEQRKLLHHIDGGAVHLRGLIQQLLDYARAEAGRLEVRTEPTALNEVVRIAAAFVEPRAREKGIAVTVDVPAEPVMAEVDPALVRQILLNLLENAVKFTDDGSVEVRLERSADGVVIHVADTGIGIPEQFHARVFEAFWQQEDTLTRRRGGLGLGLAIVRDLVAKLGGEVTVRSGGTRGTTFSVHLPAPPPG